MLVYTLLPVFSIMSKSSSEMTSDRMISNGYHFKGDIVAINKL